MWCSGMKGKITCRGQRKLLFFFLCGGRKEARHPRKGRRAGAGRNRANCRGCGEGWMPKRQSLGQFHRRNTGKVLSTHGTTRKNTQYISTSGEPHKTAVSHSKIQKVFKVLKNSAWNRRGILAEVSANISPNPHGNGLAPSKPCGKIPCAGPRGKKPAQK